MPIETQSFLLQQSGPLIAVGELEAIQFPPLHLSNKTVLPITTENTNMFRSRHIYMTVDCLLGKQHSSPLHWDWLHTYTHTQEQEQVFRCLLFDIGANTQSDRI